MASRNAGKADKERDEGTPPLEWAASLLGALFALGLVGFVLWEALTAAQQPPSIRIEILGSRDTQSGVAVEFVAFNEGGRPAAEVTIGAEKEAGQVTFDFIPAQSRRNGTIVLPRGATADAAALRVLGYREP